MKKQENVQNKRSYLYKKSTNTLDCCHKNKIEHFENDKSYIETLKEDLIVLKEQYMLITNIPNVSKSDFDFCEMVRIKDDLEYTKSRIDKIESNETEINYYINTSDILYNYYDLVENNNDSKMCITKTLSCVKVNRKKSILSYFQFPCPEPEPVLENVEEIRADNQYVNNNYKANNNGQTNNTGLKNNNETSGDRKPRNRASLLDEYLAITDTNYINDNIDNDIANHCQHCSSTDKTILNNDGISYCNVCLAVENILTDNEKPSYKDPPKEISYFSYKRINHYQEWLNQIQGKETTDIPEIVFDQIMLELRKQRITNTKELTSKKVKEILKKLKINKYYEHIPYIMNRITGIPNPNLAAELEDKLRNMFKEIQVPFLKHAPLVRKNFLSYSYVIHKFLQILEKTEYLKHFPLLKSREKLHQQEEIWKKICIDLNWKFYRSI
jgi:hypothetical protein